MADTEFVDGLLVKAPNEKAPEYVKARLSIKRDALIAWLQGRDEWVNLDIKVGQSGKWYAAVDNWKPEGKRQESRQRAPDPDPTNDADALTDDIPF